MIYGTPIDKKKYPVRSDIEFLRSHIRAFRNVFIPMYLHGTLGFSALMKQVFFLVEREERVKGHEPPITWKGLDLSIKDKHHIIHNAYRFRIHPAKNKKSREKLFTDLQTYLEKLTKQYLSSSR